jgi:cellulose synthase/poly-beta-1,6-N-acetylglucosamine synthase-like glycosyltransferase
LTTHAAQGLRPFPLPSPGLVLPIRPGFVVAIPVRDEEQRLPACLRALAQQRDQLGQPIPPALVRVAVFANNCTDRSASLARNLGASWRLDIRVVEASLPPSAAHAGNARRGAMDIAEAWLVEGGEKDGVILTTDADSQVAPNWIAQNLAAFEAGAEAVLGRIDLDSEGKFLPDALHRRGQLEDTYEGLLTELSWVLDPLEHNPWPHHATISGASLGVTRTAYCRVGRLPRVPLGEDKALIGLLSREDARIRYCPAIHVITSGRTDGRAPGGVADTLAIRSREPEAFCDDALEPFQTAFARASWRGRLRRLDAAERLVLDEDWVAEFGLLGGDVDDIFKEPAFGAAWSVIEDRSPLFARRLLRPAELPEQISTARRWLAHLREGGSGARQHVQAKLTISVAALDDAGQSNSFDEESGSLVAAEGIVRWADPMDQNDGPSARQGTRDSAGQAGDILAAQVIHNL